MQQRCWRRFLGWTIHDRRVECGILSRVLGANQAWTNRAREENSRNLHVVTPLALRPRSK